MSTIKVKGQEVETGDDLWSGGIPHRITRIEPYGHPVVTRGEQWRAACSDGPASVGRAAWGITLEFAHGWEPGHYEVSARPGDTRGEPHASADDYLSPWWGPGARLYEHYAAEGFPGPWRAWLDRRFAAVTHPHYGMSGAQLRALASRQLKAGITDWAETAHKARLADADGGLWRPSHQPAGPRRAVPDFTNGAGDRFRWDPERLAWDFLGKCPA
jgi:hypothetical protein